jgi:outer membrane protein TolC
VRRTRAEIRHGVVAAYFGAELAAARARALRQAEATAREHAERARAMAVEGLVTEADAQLAEVRALEVESDRIAAEADDRITRDELSRLLALPDGTPLILTDTLGVASGASPQTGALVEQALASRADIRAAELQLQAARSALSSARASFLPSAAIFGQYAWNDSGSLFGSEGDRWSAGILFTWTPFSGGERIGRMGEAGSGLDAAETRLDDLKRAVAAEVRAAAWRWESARRRVEVAQSAVVQAEEALGIVRVRYESELIPVTELLDAETRRTEAGLRLLAVRYEAVLARSGLALATESEIPGE